MKEGAFGFQSLWTRSALFRITHIKPLEVLYLLKRITGGHLYFFLVFECFCFTFQIICVIMYLYNSAVLLTC